MEFSSLIQNNYRNSICLLVNLSFINIEFADSCNGGNTDSCIVILFYRVGRHSKKQNLLIAKNNFRQSRSEISNAILIRSDKSSHQVVQESAK